MAFPVTVDFSSTATALINKMITAINSMNTTLNNQETTFTKLEADLATVAKQTDLAILTEIEADLAVIAKALTVSPASKLVIGTPFAIKGHITMANIVVANTAIVAWPILDENAENVVVAGPVGDAYTVTPSNPASFAAVVGTATPPGAAAAVPCVLTNALVAESDAANGGGGLTFSVTDTAGLKSATSPPFDIGPDTVPTQLAVGTMFQSGTQPVPTAPGP
jgi:hypothetical protein